MVATEKQAEFEWVNKAVEMVLEAIAEEGLAAPVAEVQPAQVAEAAPVAEGVCGTFRWIKELVRGKGVLRINGREYNVEAINVGMQVVGYKVGSWEVSTCGKHFTCSCPDYRYRRQGSETGCKHCRGLRGGLAQLKKLPA